MTAIVQGKCTFSNARTTHSSPLQIGFPPPLALLWARSCCKVLGDIKLEACNANAPGARRGVSTKLRWRAGRASASRAAGGRGGARSSQASSCRKQQQQQQYRKQYCEAPELSLSKRAASEAGRGESSFEGTPRRPKLHQEHEASAAPSVSASQTARRRRGRARADDAAPTQQSESEPTGCGSSKMVRRTCPAQSAAELMLLALPPGDILAQCVRGELEAEGERLWWKVEPRCGG